MRAVVQAQMQVEVAELELRAAERTKQKEILLEPPSGLRTSVRTAALVTRSSLHSA